MKIIKLIQQLFCFILKITNCINVFLCNKIIHVDENMFSIKRLLSENITINQNQENGKNKNSIIKIAFKKSTNNYVNCYFTSKFKSCLSPSSNSSNE